MEDRNNLLSNCCEDERDLSCALESSLEKVNKAVQFLSSPDILSITTDITKAEFLKSRGLSRSEIKEAFKRHYAVREPTNNHFLSGPFRLHPISNEHVHDSTVALVENTPKSSGFSKFFNFCQKVVLFASIASSFYYGYQKWARARDSKKKTEKNIKDELNQIRNELTKISMELRNYQLVERNQANLLAEINSLKAILVSRQYFEEKTPSKVVLPSWQLSSKTTTATTTTTPKSEEKSVDSNLKSGGSGSGSGSSSSSNSSTQTVIPTSSPANDSLAATVAGSCKTAQIPVTVSLMSEVKENVVQVEPTLTNGFGGCAAATENSSKSSSAKEAKKNAQKTFNGVENGHKLKKNERKN